MYEECEIMDVKIMLINLNDFIKDVYNQPIKLSDILKRNSFSEAEVETIKSNNIEQLLHNIDFALKCKFISSSNKLRLYKVICQRYGLFGYAKLTLREIASDMNISHERVRQIEEKAINYIKPNKRGDFLSTAIILSACQILNLDISAKLVQNDIEE